MSMLRALAKLLKNNSGATAIEYGLIAGGIALTIIPVLGDVNSGVLHIFGIVMGLFDGF